jgi:uncharacterized protein
VQFTNEFRVPADVDTTFKTLTDLERVAPCMPGATLEEVDGDVYTGRMKVKVGPIQVSYRGTAEVTEVDEEAKRAAISANGKETRGAGTAKADVTATLREDGGETVVTVVSDINVTGKPAQFGRGVMADVGEKIIGQFAERLEAMLREEPAEAAVPSGDGQAAAAAEATTEPGAEPAAAVAAAATGPRRIEQDPSREDDALDLMEVAGAATLKRVAPIVAAILVAIAIVWWLRSR